MISGVLFLVLWISLTEYSLWYRRRKRQRLPR